MSTTRNKTPFTTQRTSEHCHRCRHGACCRAMGTGRPPACSRVAATPLHAVAPYPARQQRIRLGSHLFLWLDGAVASERPAVRFIHYSFCLTLGRDRETFVDAAMTADGLPVLHIPAKSAYVPAELAAAVQQKLQ
jgi:hypothetical protein